ncbi:probable adenylate kinase 7, mitochondrial [Impatiens glandulifera]|uniref:probable adenylate kinase 7, mitochondrial n=1 Tax=Impatiens glandulifera TaxID=253017 RepID=UPI001FB16E2C|nr:probable adenylate kinase 7, mitochondrial [Impatiens glandulifera]
MAGIFRLRMAALFQTRLIPKRSYGSSAALQLQDDDDDYYEDQNNEFNPTRDNSQSSVPRRGIQWVIMGNPLAKKHLYADRLSKLLQVPYISMGTLVRQELQHSSSLYKQIANAVNQGKLVPEDIIFSLLSKRLREGRYRGENGFILDGIPRTTVQAEILDQIADIDLVVNFKCKEDEESLNRATSGIYKLNNLKEECTWKEKLRAYAELSKPLEEYYMEQEKLLDFEVNGAPGETWNGLLAALQLQQVSSFVSASSPKPGHLNYIL